VAILDTGFDLSHPDFAQRQIVTKNFVGDQQPFHDGVGHGTHCTGTATGPLHPASVQRYGIAFEALIFSGRVLDDTGSGGDFNILQGIDWAIEQGCDIASLSLGAPWVPGDPAFSPAYESAAQHALAAGCLLVVAAGNEANDPRFVGAVGTPGNSPSVLTVAAIDRNLATAPFSNSSATGCARGKRTRSRGARCRRVFVMAGEGGSLQHDFRNQHGHTARCWHCGTVRAGQSEHSWSGAQGHDTEPLHGSAKRRCAQG